MTVSVGHCHPKVVSAVNRQSELLQHITPIYLNHQHAQYAKELTDRMPGNLKVGRGPFLVCSEAPRQQIDACCKSSLMGVLSGKGSQTR